MRNSTLGAILLLFSTIASYGQVKTWSLQECIDYAVKNSITVQKSEAQTQIEQETLKQQKAAWLPTVSASVSQSMTYRPFQEGITSYVNGNSTTSSADKTSYNGSYGVNAGWTVYNGNQTNNNIKVAKLSLQQSELDTEQQINSIKEQIVEAYINILYTREALNVNRELLKQDEVLYERGKEMLKQGQIANYELLELQSNVADGRYDTVSTQVQIDQYKLQLKLLMNLPGDEDFEISDVTATDAKALALIPQTMDVYNQAVAQRPEVKDAELSIDEAELNLKIARAGYLPTVSLSAGLGDNHSSGSDHNWFKQMKYNFDASLGLSISVPIFDQRQNKTNIRKAKINKIVANLDKQDVENELYNTIRTYRLNAYNNQQKYIASKERLNYNKEMYDAVYTKATIGTMDIEETMNARSTLLNAQQELLQTKYTTIFNHEMLDFYAGNEIDL